MATAVLTVEGMTCNHCRMSVTKAVNALSGVKSVDVDLQSKKVTVEYEEGAVDESAFKKAIEEAGYEVV